MNPKSIDLLFWEAARLGSDADRADYLDRECSGSPAVREKVEQLLAVRAEAAAFLERPPLSAPASDAGDTLNLVPDGGDPTVEAEPRPAEAGVVVGGRYKLLEEIGVGGMGSVWMAEQTDPVKRRVAVKLIKPGMDSKQVVARFEAERQALALMDHPNIARVLDGGATADGRPYFVMELVKGTPITRYCDEKRLTVCDRLALFADVCRAVQHAHQKGVIHRDLKPSNILVAPYDGRPVVKVIDFGVAKATGQKLTDATLFTGFGAVVGTPEYMSPEQAELNNADIDTRSDVYSLGVLLYELLTGSTPLTRRRAKEGAILEVLRLVREEEPPRPSTRLSTTDELPSIAAGRGVEPARLSKLVRGELDWIVMKALEKDRTRRYETANGLAADVQRYLSDEAVQACPPSAGYRLRKFARRNRPAVLTGLVVLTSVAIGLSVAVWQAVVAIQARAATESALHDKEQALIAESVQRTRAEEQTNRANDSLAAARASEADTRAFSEFLVEDVVSAARPEGSPGGLGIRVTVKEALDSAAARIEKRFQNRPLAEALIRHELGVTYRMIGQLDASEQQFRRAFRIRSEMLGADHLQTIDSANSLAVLYLTVGKYDLAEPLLLQALKWFEHRLGKENDSTVACQSNLGILYLRLLQHRRAEPLLVECLEIRRRQLGVGNDDTLSSMNNLGYLYKQMGRMKEAELMLTEAYDVSRRIPGEDRPPRITLMNSLGELYLARGALSAAEPLLVKALELRRRNLGEEHPETLGSMTDVGMLRQRQGRFDEAEVLLQKAMEYRRRLHGETHRWVLDSMNNLAGLYFTRRNLAKAEPLLLECVTTSRRLYGAKSEATVHFLNNLAGLYHAQGKVDKAIPVLIEAIEGLRHVHGDDNVLTIVANGNLGAVYRTNHEFAKAETQLLATIATSRRALGESDADTLSFINELRMVYEDQELFAKGEVLCRELVDKVRANRESTPGELASSLATLSLNLLKQQKHVEAEKLLRECLAIRERVEAQDWRTFNTRSMLGASLLGQKKYAEAEPLLRSGYEGMKARENTIPDVGIARIAECLDRLIEVATVLGPPDAVKKYTELRSKYPAAPPPRTQGK